MKLQIYTLSFNTMLIATMLIAVVGCAGPSSVQSVDTSTDTNASPSPTVSAMPQATPPEAVVNSPDAGIGLQGGVSSITGAVSDLEGAMQDLGAKEVGNQIAVELPADVLFDFNQANIRPDAAAALNKLLTIIKAQPSSGPVRIEGYTDALGSDTYNQKLSEQRAVSVKTWLTTQGITASRLQPQGFGETKPRAPNTKPNGSDSPEGRQQNRRVEVFITKG
jgi:outer membrane protein OmpA-like peptidoglycan-associated protein